MSEKRKGSSAMSKPHKTPAIKKGNSLPAIAKAMPNYDKPSASRGR